jgi:uncharacterized protein
VIPAPLSPETHDAAAVVRMLGLEPLDQEGGFFRRVAEAPLVLPAGVLPAGLQGDHRAYSVIYLLLTPAGFSALHRLAQDEIWFFLAGDPVESLRLTPGRTGWVRLDAAEHRHDIIPARTWQGTRLVAGGRWALCSMVVVPEFLWSDFELAERTTLAVAYPAHTADIAALTRTAPPAGTR